MNEEGEIGLPALHEWIRKNKPMSETCEICGKPENYENLGKLELSNITGKFIKDINNFQWAHRSCHKHYNVNNEIYGNHEHKGISKFIAFRCSWDLYEEVLKDKKNMSKFIKNAIKSYKGKEFRDDLLNAFLQYSKLFHLIELNFKNRDILGINELVSYVQSAITNTKVIDKIEATLNG